MRDRLIELIEKAVVKSEFMYPADVHSTVIADYLLANGVVVLDTNVVYKENRPLIKTVADMPLNDVIELVKAKQEGRIIVPPCKVGDMVYQIKYCRCGNPECYENKHCYKKDTKKTPKVYGGIMLRQYGKRLKRNSYMFEKPQWEWKSIGTICYKIIKKPFKLEWLTEIGKTVFLTKEEAEAKLKERVGND